MIYREKAHGMQRLNGRGDYNKTKRFDFNPLEAVAEYYFVKDQYETNKLRLGDILRLMIVNRNQKSQHNDRILKSRMVGRHAFAEDVLTGPFPLIDLCRAVTFVHHIGMLGGSVPLSFDFNSRQCPVVMTADGSRWPESHETSAREIGWVEVKGGVARLPITLDEPFFFEECTKRRPDTLATGPFGLEFIQEVAAECRKLITIPRRTT